MSKEAKQMNETDGQSSEELALWIAKQIDRKGGIHINVLDLRSSSDVTDFIVIATGTSYRHMQTLIETPIRELKKSGFASYKVEGEGTSWLVADFSDVIVHIFDEPTRSYYNLEGLYANAPDLLWDKH